MYDVCLFVGHGEGDNGAVGNGYIERELAYKLVGKILTILSKEGVQALTNYYDGKNNYNNNLTKGKEIKYKFGYEFHLNSSSDVSAKGVEIISPINEIFLDYEFNIACSFRDIGLSNRGVKSRDYNTELFYQRQNNVSLGGRDWYRVIREAWENGISLSIVEACFISNNNDVQLFINNIDKLALDISNVILRACDKTPVNSTTQPNVDVKYQVVTGSFSNRDNANKRVQELKEKGFDSFIQIK